MMEDPRQLGHLLTSPRYPPLLGAQCGDPGALAPQVGRGSHCGSSVPPPPAFQKAGGVGDPAPALGWALAAATLVNQG